MADHAQREYAKPSMRLLTPIALNRARAEFADQDRLQRATPQPQPQEWHAGDRFESRTVQRRAPALEDFNHLRRRDVAAQSSCSQPLCDRADLVCGVYYANQLRHGAPNPERAFPGWSRRCRNLLFRLSARA